MSTLGAASSKFTRSSGRALDAVDHASLEPQADRIADGAARPNFGSRNAGRSDPRQSFNACLALSAHGLVPSGPSPLVRMNLRASPDDRAS